MFYIHIYLSLRVSFIIDDKLVWHSFYTLCCIALLSIYIQIKLQQFKMDYYKYGEWDSRVESRQSRINLILLLSLSAFLLLMLYSQMNFGREHIMQMSFYIFQIYESRFVCLLVVVVVVVALWYTIHIICVVWNLFSHINMFIWLSVCPSICLYGYVNKCV